MQYSIWLIPPEPLYSQIKSVIDGLAAKYQGPVFEPHMTLQSISQGEFTKVEAKLREFSKQIDSLKLSLGPVSFSTTYFQSVFIRVNSTAKLMQLNLDVKKLFNEDNTVFMSHISLLYGEHDMATRERAANTVSLPETEFVVKNFVIIPATINPNDWKHLATIPLGK